MKKTNTDLTLEQCDELRRITERHIKHSGLGNDDETFESVVEKTAEQCDGEFSPQMWTKAL